MSREYIREASEERAPSFFFHDRLIPGDFAQRWSRARISVLRKATNAVPAYAPSLSENELLRLVPSEKHEEVLRGIFDVGRQLGKSLGRYLGLSAESSDFAELLGANEVPCFRGSWRAKGDALLLARPGCGIPGAVGSFGCDYWREAVDGLVIGASDNVRLARHRSAGHGDSECLDILFLDEGSGPSLGRHRGDIPENFMSGLAVLTRQFAEKGVSLRWDGYSEGVLFYRMEAGASPLCGAGGQLMHSSLLAEIQKFFPGIQARDGSPLAVYGGAE